LFKHSSQFIRNGREERKRQNVSLESRQLEESAKFCHARGKWRQCLDHFIGEPVLAGQLIPQAYGQRNEFPMILPRPIVDRVTLQQHSGVNGTGATGECVVEL
jgi:hypothetical protein